MKYLFSVLFCCLSFILNGQTARISGADSICGHQIFRDQNLHVLGWYKPEVPGAVYDKVIHLATGFLKNTPVEPSTGLPLYLVTCCFQGSHMTGGKGIIAEHWAHNPACVYAGAVQSLALQYRAYTGDHSVIDLVRNMLDYQLEHGTTPENWVWACVPYA
ncbi:MAG: hypothetical protein V2B15_19750, partial [Bacteroidota bacterium]